MTSVELIRFHDGNEAPPSRNLNLAIRGQSATGSWSFSPTSAPMKASASTDPESKRFLSETTIEDRPLDSWNDLIQNVEGQFVEAVKGWRDEYEPILEAWLEIEDRRQATEGRRQAAALRYQLRALYELTVIEALADRQFLPHYGFPIGVQKLRVISPDENQPNRIRVEDQYRLERNSLLALREYVPGSKLLAGGRLVTSHGLLKHWTGAEIDNYIGYRGLYTSCVNEHFYYWNTPDMDMDCPICGAQAEKSPTQFMFPKHGFSGAAWDPPKWSTNIEIVGEPQTDADTFIYDMEPDLFEFRRSQKFVRVLQGRRRVARVQLRQGWTRFRHLPSMWLR